jgi:hypothetical protein
MRPPAGGDGGRVGKVKVKHLGPGYYGGRDYDGTDISAKEGDVLLVTERRAEKLLADHPRRFERVGEEEVLRDEHASAGTAEPPDPPTAAVAKKKRGGRRGTYPSTRR